MSFETTHFPFTRAAYSLISHLCFICQERNAGSFLNRKKASYYFPFNAASCIKYKKKGKEEEKEERFQ
jgi:hypothetical protein